MDKLDSHSLGILLGLDQSEDQAVICHDSLWDAKPMNDVALKEFDRLGARN